MQFGIVHFDPSLDPLVQAILKSAPHELCFIMGPESSREQPDRRSLAPSPPDLTSALAQFPVDAVIFGMSGTPQERFDQLRNLVQTSMPLIVTHPVGDAVSGFELQMIQQESESPIIPYFSGVFHRVLEDLAHQISGATPSPIGRVLQVVATRYEQGLDFPAAQQRFSQDTLVTRKFTDRIVRLNAMRSGTGDSSDWENLSVQMEDAGGRVIRWSLAPGSPEGLAICILGDSGQAELDLRGPPSMWTAVVKERDGDPLHAQGAHLASSDPSAETVLALLADALQDPQAKRTIDRLWESACRSVELAEAIEWSARRGKTVELFHESLSEESTFKGMMAAGGCFALVAALGLIPLVILAELFLPGLAQSGSWRRLPWIVLLVFLVGFLGLQFLRLLARRPPK